MLVILVQASNYRMLSHANPINSLYHLLAVVDAKEGNILVM